MKQYLELLQNILDNGVEKESGRANMPNTIGISNAVIHMDMKDGFPLLTTKKIAFRSIVHELLWFISGNTNIKYLVDNGVHIWDSDSYRWYLKHCNDNNIEVYFDTIEKFVDFIKNKDEILSDYEKSDEDIKLQRDIEKHLSLLFKEYEIGDLGKVYGYQWRNQNGVDQVRDVIEGLRDNPYSRYHIIDAWLKSDFKEMALPPCHLLYQFIVRPLSFEERFRIYESKVESFYTNDCNTEFLDKNNIPKFYLDLNMYQRSCDTALGVPYNLASMSLLLEIFAKTSNMIPGVATWIGGDTHLYVNHVDIIKEQIKRTPFKLPTIKILKDIKTLDDILSLTIEDFQLENYQSHPRLDFQLFTGLKK
jgi:thymidylate synthase